MYSQSQRRRQAGQWPNTSVCCGVRLGS